MAVNKVDINGETIIDLTDDTVSPDALLEGYTAHNQSGMPITGRLAPGVTSINSRTGDVVIGGRNLITNPEKYEGGVSLTGSANTALYFMLTDYGVRAADKVGTVLTFSFDVKANGSPVNGFTTRMRKGSDDASGLEYLSGGITTEWKRLSCQLTTTLEGSDRVDIVARGSSSVEGQMVFVRNVQLELGNVATDWIPAPEDKQDKLTGTQEQLVGFDESGNAIPIAPADVIHVGGRNLVNTADPYQIISSTAKNIVVEGESIRLIYADTSVDTYFYVKTMGNLKGGEQYTLSFDCDGVKDGDDLIYQIGTSSSMEGNTAARSFKLVNGRVTKSFVPVNDINTNRIMLDDVNDATNRPSNTDIILSNFKIEVGNIATDYTPAPEGKQDRLIGSAGQTIGFDVDGTAVPAMIGGRNLLLDGSKERAIAVGTANASTYYMLSDYGKIIADSIGTVLTLSFDIRAESLPVSSLAWRVRAEGSNSSNLYYCEDEVTTEWKRLSAQLHINHSGNDRVHLVVGGMAAGSNTIYLRNVQFELGMVATDFIPAPEDKQDKMTGTNGQFVGFDDDGNPIAVAPADVIHVGGRNLALSTEKTSNKPLDTAGHSIEYKLSDYGQNAIDGKGVVLMASFDAMASGKLNAGANARIQNSSGDNVSNLVNVRNYLTDGWQRFTVKLTTTAEGGDKFVFIVSGNADNSGTLYFRNLKLELGNVVTDYTPAPEDLEARIAAMEATLGTTAAQSSNRMGETMILPAETPVLVPVGIPDEETTLEEQDGSKIKELPLSDGWEIPVSKLNEDEPED